MTAYDPVRGRSSDAPWDAFARLVSALAGTRTDAEVAAAVAEHAGCALSASSCLVAALDEHDRDLRLLAATGYPPGPSRSGSA